MKRLLIIFLSVVLIAVPTLSLTGCGNTDRGDNNALDDTIDNIGESGEYNTELSEEDQYILNHYIEPTLDMNFYDNEVWVILKSAYDYLTELKFSDLKIVEEVSPISHIWYNLKEYTYEDGAVPFKEGDTQHMFKITLEEHSKEKVVAVCKLLQSLDMVLVADPYYIYDITSC